jgi:hypothetical protein
VMRVMLCASLMRAGLAQGASLRCAWNVREPSQERLVLADEATGAV